MSKRRNTRSTWSKVRNFFQDMYERGPNWRMVWRGRMLSAKLGPKTQVETYRLYLTRAGYLRHVSRGMYLCTRPIPWDLTTTQVYRKAYPKTRSQTR